MMMGPRLRRLAPGILAFLVLVSGVALWGQTLARGDASRASAQAGSRLDIDAVPGNGSRPCDPIDTAASVVVGATYAVAVCVGDYVSNDLEAFEIIINYNSALQTGPETADVAPALDDNPDANDGDDPTGFKLGGGWDCTALGFTFPSMDDAVLPGMQARIICNADIVNPDRDLAAQPGLLATVTFNTLADGTDVLTFGDTSALAYTSSGTRSCGSIPAELIPCAGATITIGAGGPPPVTLAATPSGPAATPSTSGTPGPGPGATPTPLPPGMEAQSLAAGCNPVTSTYGDNTPVQTIAGAVGPEGSLTSLWKFDSATGAWLGYSPQFRQASDLTAMAFLDVVFVCVSEPGAFVKPIV